MPIGYCRFVLFDEHLLAWVFLNIAKRYRRYCVWARWSTWARRLFIASVRRRSAVAGWSRPFRPRSRFFKLVLKIKAIVGMGRWLDQNGPI